MAVKLSVKKFHWSFVALYMIFFSLLIWTIRKFSWMEITKLFSSFHFREIVLLALVNIMILSLFTYRWAIIHSTLQKNIPFKNLFIYRLISFGISYFTPGPQIGGEPAQILLLTQNHNISKENAIPSVVLDRLIDALVNFLFLTFGFIVLINSNFLKEIESSFYLYAFIVLLILPVVYLIFLLKGSLPLTKILKKMISVKNKKRLDAIIETLVTAESQMSSFIRKYPVSFLKVILVSIFAWGMMAYEYWLMLHVLGVKIDGLALVSIITITRLAFLTPIPAGLGALEAGQILVMQSLGFSPLVGISAAFYIRIRDSIIGLSGIFLASIFLSKRKVMKEVLL